MDVDETALLSQLRAFDETDAVPADWFVEQLSHPGAEVRYWAMTALASRRSTVDDSLGRIAAELVAEAGGCLWHEVRPWAGRRAVGKLAVRLAEHHPGWFSGE